MRAFLILWATIAVVGSAAPAASTKPSRGPTDSGRFASRLGPLIEQIAEQYYRPIPVEKLYVAVMASLYQAAKRPIPADLPGQVREAIRQARVGEMETTPREQCLVRAYEEASLSAAFAERDPIRVACDALSRQLDPHSGLVTAEEQRRAVGLDYEGLGVGLELLTSSNPGPLEVEGVAFGGPAQRAGMRPGDRIIRVNGIAVEKLSPELRLALGNQRVSVGPAELGSEEQSTVEVPRVLHVRYRRGSQPAERSAELYRDRFRPETILGVSRSAGNEWSYLWDSKAGIAHVRLINLSRGTSEELRRVLDRLTEQKIRGIVFDLRWCPGGYLNEAVDVADLFVGDALIATVKMRGREDTLYKGSGRPACPTVPIVVLVNAETSGGAELIAAAMQDHRRADVCGQRTRGKASVQTPLAVGIDGIGFKLTSGTFLRPSGKNLHRSPDSRSRDDWGVIPNEDYRISPELSRRYAEEWQRWSLRPSWSVERLALDDPTFDVQREAAVRMLKKKLEKK